MHTQTQMKMSLESDAFAAQNFAKRNSFSMYRKFLRKTLRRKVFFHAQKFLTGCHRKKEPKGGYVHKIIA